MLTTALFCFKAATVGQRRVLSKDQLWLRCRLPNRAAGGSMAQTSPHLFLEAHHLFAGLVLADIIFYGPHAGGILQCKVKSSSNL